MIEFIEEFRNEIINQKNAKIFTGLDVLVEMIFCCGFRRGEIGKITVGYLKGEGIKKRISLCQETVDSYLKLLKQEKDDDFNDDLQLFPGYSGKSGEKKFNRHFSTITSRVCGQGYSYSNLIADGMEYFWKRIDINDRHEKIEWISEQYDRTLQTIENTLHLCRDRKQPESKSCGYYQGKLISKFENHAYRHLKELFMDILRYNFYTVHRRYGSEADYPKEVVTENLRVPGKILLNRVGQIKFNADEIAEILNLVHDIYLPEIENSTLKDLKDFLNDVDSEYDDNMQSCVKFGSTSNMHPQLESPDSHLLMISSSSGQGDQSKEIMIPTSDRFEGENLDLSLKMGDNSAMLTDRYRMKNDLANYDLITEATEEAEETEEEFDEDSETDDPRNVRKCIENWEMMQSEIESEKERKRLEDKYYEDDDYYGDDY